MAGEYLNLEQAAEKLGLTLDELRNLREAGEIHGYRDGSSWKFKSGEVDRASENLASGGLPGGPSDPGDDSSSFGSEDIDSLVSLSDSSGEFESDELDESSILVTEDGEGDSEKDSSTIIGKEKESAAVPDSDLKLSDDLNDIALEPDAEAIGDDPSVKLASSDIGMDASESDASGAQVLGDSDLSLAPEEASGKEASGFELSSDELLLEKDSELVSAAQDLALSDDDELLLGDDSASSEDDFELSIDDDDIHLDESSDSVSLGSDSESESSKSSARSSDEGLQLSDESLVVPGAASDDGEPLLPDEEFMLAPSEDLLGDESSDSGSQVIALEDSDSISTDISGALVPDSASGIDADVSPFTPISTPEGISDPAAMMAIPDSPYSVVNVLWLLILVSLLGATGILLMDIVRNMWTWRGEYAATSWLMEAIVSALQL